MPFGPCLLLICLIAPAVGCGSAGSSVQGTVSYQGTPIEKGMVTFTPVEGKGSVVGCNIENGKFSATGVTPGKNVLTVVAPTDLEEQLSTDAARKKIKEGNSFILHQLN